jgi:hypothetical protein
MVENSLTDGALYRYRDPKTGEGDAESMLLMLKNFWRAVRLLWAEDWELPPRRSRLLHGVGVVALGFLMDAIADQYWDDEIPSEELFFEHLEPVAPICRWSSGYWDFGPHAQRKWNELQNTPKDVQLLANHLLSEYKAKVWSQTLAEIRK